MRCNVFSGSSPKESKKVRNKLCQDQEEEAEAAEAVADLAEASAAVEAEVAEDLAAVAAASATADITITVLDIIITAVGAVPITAEADVSADCWD